MIIAIIVLVIILALLWWAHGEGVPVFLYHEVRKDSGTHPLLLESEMSYLASKKAKSFNFTTAKNYIDMHGKLPRNSVIITLDDGYEDNYSKAYPIFKKHNISATIFVNSGFVGKKAEFLTYEQMREMHPLIDVQTHTRYHNKNFSSLKLIGVIGIFGELKNGVDDIYGISREVGFPILEYGGEITHRKLSISSAFFIQFKKYFDENLSDLTEKEILERGQGFVNERADDICIESDEMWKKRVAEAYLCNRRDLEKGSGQQIEHLAWPWGYYNKKTHQWLKESGVVGFATCIRGTNSRKLNFEWIRRNSIQNANMKKFKFRYFICKNLILGWIYEKLSTKNAKWEIKE
ncbi:MAG: polysaccharide deacetylase family protein [Fusobacteria bacterium]|nr:polysaccharide deacetylase family protein [Fusobacteriota bacterium]